MAGSNVGIQLAFAIIALIAAVFYSGRSQFLLNKVNRLIQGKGGCAPVSGVGDVTLHYSGNRGRAEGIRLMMEDNGIQYQDTSYSKVDWPAIEQKGIETGLFTFGQVPAISTTSGLQLVQTRAIMHYLGRSLGLDCDCQDMQLCEVIVLGADDLLGRMGQVKDSPDFSAETRDNYMNTIAKQWLPYFEKLAPVSSSEKEKFFIGDRITWVDYVMFDLLESHIEFARMELAGKTYQDTEVLANYPKLNVFFNKFASRPKLATYLKAERRMPFTKP